MITKEQRDKLVEAGEIIERVIDDLENYRKERFIESPKEAYLSEIYSDLHDYIYDNE